MPFLGAKYKTNEHSPEIVTAPEPLYKVDENLLEGVLRLRDSQDWCEWIKDVTARAAQDDCDGLIDGAFIKHELGPDLSIREHNTRVFLNAAREKKSKVLVHALKRNIHPEHLWQIRDLNVVRQIITTLDSRCAPRNLGVFLEEYASLVSRRFDPKTETFSDFLNALSLRK